MSEIREARLQKANLLIDKGFEPYGETFKISLNSTHPLRFNIYLNINYSSKLLFAALLLNI